MKESVREFVVVASICSYVADGFLTETLQDDRVAMRMAELEQWPADGFRCLAWGGILGHISWSGPVPHGHPSLEDHPGCACLCRFHSLSGPRCCEAVALVICQGNRGAKLDALLRGDSPQDATALKISKLMKLGFNRFHLEEALALLAQCSWSSFVTEQGHGAASSIRKRHEEYSAETLVCRAILQSMAPLFASSEEEKCIEKIKSQIQFLEGRRPNCITGRQMYVKALLKMTDYHRRQARKLKDDVNLRVMKNHSSGWAALPHHAKQKFASEADDLKRKREVEIFDNIGHLWAKLALQKLRSQEEIMEDQGPLRVSSCRLTPAVMQEFDRLFHEPAFSNKFVEARRFEAVAPPAASDEFKKALEQCDEPSLPAPRAPWWLGPVCRCREYLEEAIFRIDLVEGGISYYKLLFATQSPLDICFEVVSKVRVALLEKQAVGSIGFEFVAKEAWAEDFEVELAMPFVTMHHLLPLGEHKVEVLWDAVFLGQQRLSSHSDWVPLDVLLESLPCAGKADGVPEEAGKAVRKLMAHELAAFPSLLAILDGWHEQQRKQAHFAHCQSAPSSRPGGATKLKANGEEEKAEEVEVDEEEIFEALYKKRAMLHVEVGAAKASDFAVAILGGAWTMAHLGVAYDAYQGKASGNDPTEWCTKLSLAKSARFSIAAYGDRHANILAAAWCSHMQHLYDMWDRDDAGFVYGREREPWAEPRDFSDFAAGASGAALKRCEQIRVICPT